MSRKVKEQPPTPGIDLIFELYIDSKLTKTFWCFLQKIFAKLQDIFWCKICIHLYVNYKKIINLDLSDFFFNLFVIPILYFNCTHFLCIFKTLIFAKRVHIFLCKESRVNLHFICNYLLCM